MLNDDLSVLRKENSELKTKMNLNQQLILKFMKGEIVYNDEDGNFYEGKKKLEAVGLGS